MKVNVYMIASVMDKYMFPYDGKVYKKKSTAEKKCFELNKKYDTAYVVLCANNWN